MGKSIRSAFGLRQPDIPDCWRSDSAEGVAPADASLRALTPRAARRAPTGRPHRPDIACRKEIASDLRYLT